MDDIVFLDALVFLDDVVFLDDLGAFWSMSILEHFLLNS